MPEREVVFGFGAHSGIDDVPELLRLAQQADRDGLDIFTLSDHPYIGERLDAYAAIGFILGRTQQISGFVNVTNLPTRPAPMLARTVTSLSALSGGRIVLGHGRGRAVGPHRRHGRAPAVAGRGRGRLRGGDRPGQAAVGRRPAGHLPGPALPGAPDRAGARGRAPVWTGSVGRKSLAATGRVADGWVPGHAADWLSERYRASRPVIDEAAAAGPRSARDPYGLQLPRTHHRPAAGRHPRRRRPLARRLRRPVGRGADRGRAGARRVGFHALPPPAARTDATDLARWARRSPPPYARRASGCSCAPLIILSTALRGPCTAIPTRSSPSRAPPRPRPGWPRRARCRTARR